MFSIFFPLCSFLRRHFKKANKKPQSQKDVQVDCLGCLWWTPALQGPLIKKKSLSFLQSQSSRFLISSL